MKLNMMCAVWARQYAQKSRFESEEPGRILLFIKLVEESAAS